MRLSPPAHALARPPLWRLAIGLLLLPVVVPLLVLLRLLEALFAKDARDAARTLDDSTLEQPPPRRPRRRRAAARTAAPRPERLERLALPGVWAGAVLASAMPSAPRTVVRAIVRPTRFRGT